MTDIKIFDDQGFMTKQGKTFVDDGFTKELKRVMATATSPTDVQIISGLLKSLVDNYGCNLISEFNNKVEVKSIPKSKFSLLQGGKSLSNQVPVADLLTDLMSDPTILE